ncbi:GNAT family N-acetyltransferase [Vibrio cholerae]|uniref:GNAT family N-acetyltransferase n=1 Tax=Vibrio metoecus TaxID=1481663 RepID=UPI000BA8E4AD|nr:GNAT family N-acetyltransferase [Vibrio metoecus]PAR34254.1 hypothetical protein CGT97_17160 [Vibrio metoecus]PAR38136.1 hypothetical protein CGT96_19320 [Vibrio metoecus]
MISLRNVIRSDLKAIHRFAQEIQSEQFMSRYLPHGANYEQMQQNAFVWKIILVDDCDAGVIWLDKTVSHNEVVLGIMLFSSTLFGQGIGQSAIKLLMSELVAMNWTGFIKLNVRAQNDRAIACYKRLGFEVIGTDSKAANGKLISYHQMINSLKS